MKSLSYGEFDSDNFLELISYLAFVNKKHKLNTILIHPNYYKCNMINQSSGIWYEIRQCSKAENGFDMLEYGDLKLKVVISSLMDGKWCVI